MTQTSIKHQLNKRKLSKQQKAAAIYMTFYFYHDTDMWWMRGYQIKFSACGPPRSCVQSSWCWCKIINIIWREGGEGIQKNDKRGDKSNTELELSNFRYHRNCYQEFVNKLQINTAKSTYDHNYILKIILNKKNKIWKTKELLDTNWNTGGTESISTRLVNTFCLIENIDWLG